jgi:hypothetical protein
MTTSDGRDARYWLGQILCEQRRYDEAVRILAEARRFCLPDPFVDLLLLSARRGTGVSWSALEPDIARTIMLAPDWPNAQLCASKAFIALDLLDKAHASILSAMASANSVAMPDDPLVAFLEYAETGRLATDTARLVRKLSDVRSMMLAQRPAVLNS